MTWHEASSARPPFGSGVGREYKIHRYIAQDNPQAAVDVSLAIEAAIERLRSFPDLSLRTVRNGLYGVIMGTYPYIVFFRVRRGELLIVHVLHAAQRHPAFQEPTIAFAH